MASTGFSISELFANPNFQSALAGAAQAIDPEGFGGRLGAVAQRQIQSKAAQDALAGQEATRQASNLLAIGATTDPSQGRDKFINAAINMLGGITPAGVPGVTSLKVGNGGELNITVDPPAAQQQVTSGAQQTNNSGGTQTTPTTSVSPTNLATTTPVTNTPVTNTAQRNLSDLLPFY